MSISIRSVGSPHGCTARTGVRTFAVLGRFAGVALVVTLLAASAPASAQEASPEIRQELQGAADEMTRAIADLEKELASARTRGATAEAARLQQELGGLRRNLNLIQGMTKPAVDTPAKRPSGVGRGGVPGTSTAAAGQSSDTSDPLTSDIPPQDRARIAKVRRSPVATAEMDAYLAKIRSEVEPALSRSTRDTGAAALRDLQNLGGGAPAVEGAAIGAWLTGDLELALLLAGRAASLAPADPNVLNNYSAFLVMAGGEPSALPILYSLDRSYPGNSTVLNNIGQAWFGLGDIDEARKSLDEAIRRYPLHSQANLTVSLIEEARGNPAAAAAALRRSIQFGYSAAKETRLRRLGHPIEPRDIHFSLHMPQDPLGLHRFQVPPYPMTVKEAVDLDPKWETFQTAVNAAANTWDAKLNALADEYSESEGKRMEGYALAAARGQRPANLALPGPYARKAGRLLVAENEDYGRRLRLWNERDRSVRAEVDRLEKQFNAETMAVEDNYANRLEDTTREQCAQLDEVANRWMRAVNALLRDLQGDRLAIEMRWVNESTYLQQFTSTSDLQLETEKARGKSHFLDQLRGLRHVSREPCGPSGSAAAAGPGRHPLPDFDVIHCDYHTRLDFGLVKYDLACNRMTTKFKAGPLKGRIVENVQSGHWAQGSLDIGPLSGTLTQDERTGELIKGTLEGSIGAKGSVDAGPVAVEVGATIGGYVEVGKDGIEDIGMSGGVKVSAETVAWEGVEVETPVGEKTILEQKGPSVEIEIGVRAGVNAGPSLESKGTLNPGFGAAEKSF